MNLRYTEKGGFSSSRMRKNFSSRKYYNLISVILQTPLNKDNRKNGESKKKESLVTSM